MDAPTTLCPEHIAFHSMLPHPPTFIPSASSSGGSGAWEGIDVDMDYPI